MQLNMNALKLLIACLLEVFISLENFNHACKIHSDKLINITINGNKKDKFMYIHMYICVFIPYMHVHICTYRQIYVCIMYVNCIHKYICLIYYPSSSLVKSNCSNLKETRQRNKLVLIKRYHSLSLWNLWFGSESSLAKTCISVFRTNEAD